MNPLNFILYLWVTCITPGPNTITAMIFGNRYGFRKALPFNLGIFSGVLTLALLSSLLGNALFTLFPALKVILKWAGIFYLLWLAWRIFRSGPLVAETSKQVSSFSRGYLLQFINVKGIVYSITSMGTFVLPYTENRLFILFSAFLMSAVALLATMIWSAFGSLFRTLFERHYKMVHTAFALLLAYLAWTLY